MVWFLSISGEQWPTGSAGPGGPLKVTTLLISGKGVLVYKPWGLLPFQQAVSLNRSSRAEEPWTPGKQGGESSGRECTETRDLVCSPRDEGRYCLLCEGRKRTLRTVQSPFLNVSKWDRHYCSTMR